MDSKKFGEFIATIRKEKGLDAGRTGRENKCNR